MSVRERRKSSRRRHSHSGPRVERIVIEERTERRQQRAGGGGSVRSVRTGRSRSVGSLDSMDEVVVIEEGGSPSPPPSRRRSRSGRESGYREVDPMAYGGGDVPMKKVRKERR